MSEIETKKKLLSSRKDLLEIGLRSRMIRFGTGVKGLMMVDELSEEVLRIYFTREI